MNVFPHFIEISIYILGGTDISVDTNCVKKYIVFKMKPC